VTFFGRKIDEKRHLLSPLNWAIKKQPFEMKRKAYIYEDLAWMLN